MAFTTSGQETEWALFLQPWSPHRAVPHDTENLDRMTMKRKQHTATCPGRNVASCHPAVCDHARYSTDDYEPVARPLADLDRPSSAQTVDNNNFNTTAFQPQTTDI